MHDFKSRVLRYVVTPPGTLWRKVVRRMKAAGVQGLRRLVDRYRSSYMSGIPPGQLFLHLKSFPLQEASANAKTLRTLSEHYLAHRFDLLGSGWVTVHHNTECRGVEGHRHMRVSQQGLPITDRVNPANRNESSRLWALLDNSYRPMDWQLDFKSGFRWREDSWYKDIAIYTGCHGADIKVPWELARCQHLPQLALAYGLARAGVAGFREGSEYLREFRNQIVDFMASNPPRFGVNWVCPMDIGIRVANWLMAYDLFVAAGAKFDAAFDMALRRSIHAHGAHIAGNLEWNEEYRTNHYLADLAGLLFAGAYLPSSAETDRWIQAAAVEMMIEIPEQFNDDGTNFEASTCYHRLSLELVVYAIALVMSVVRQRLPLPWQVSETRHGGFKTTWETERQIFSPSLTGKLERAAEFTMHITKNDGHVTQIGDNDSGRLFKLQPAGRAISVGRVRNGHENLSGYSELRDENDYWLEDSLDHRHIVGGIGALFARQDFADFAKPFALDAAVIRTLAGVCRFPSYRDTNQPLQVWKVHEGLDNKFTNIAGKLQSLTNSSGQIYRFPLEKALCHDSVEAIAYPDFGLYIFRSAYLYLAIRCGPRCQTGNGSHAHQDQLAVELVVGGHDFALDPGTYLYTALPKRRNEYRAAAAHFAPRIAGMEFGNLKEIFSLADTSRAECLYFGPRGFIGTHNGYGTPVYRVVAFENEHIEIRDYAESRMLEVCRFSDVAGVSSHYLGPPYSAGYGWRVRTPIKT